jgi:hypothetical protein
MFRLLRREILAAPAGLVTPALAAAQQPLRQVRAKSEPSQSQVKSADPLKVNGKILALGHRTGY